MTIASSVWAMRHVRGRSSPAECGQKRDGEDRPHGDHTKGENGVGDANRSASIMSGGLVIQRPADVDHDSHDQRASNPVMHTPPDTARKSRQVSANQKRLKEHEAQSDNPCESGQDVDRTAPCELRARRRGGERHANGGREGDPDQGHPGQSPTLRLQRDQTV